MEVLATTQSTRSSSRQKEIQEQEEAAAANRRRSARISRQQEEKEANLEAEAHGSASNLHEDSGQDDEFPLEDDEIVEQDD